MKIVSHRPSRSLGAACRSLCLAAVAVVGIASVAKAANYTGPYSDNGLAPTPLTFSLGDNIVSGDTGGFVSSYMTFDIAQGDVLSSIVVLDGSSAPDRTFFGIASGNIVSVDPSFTSAAGLIGWTLYSSADDNTNVLGALGAAAPANFPAVPGATGFTPPLGSGTYSTWVVDGEGAAGSAPFKLDFVVSAAPEPSTWMLMLAGVGLAGMALRRRHGRTVAAA